MENFYKGEGMKKTPILLVVIYLMISCMVAVGYNRIEKQEDAAVQAWNPNGFETDPMQTAKNDSEAMQTGEEDKPDRSSENNKPEEDTEEGQLVLMSGVTPGVSFTPTPTEPPALTGEPTTTPETEDSDDGRVEVTYNGKVIGYINTDYRMEEETLKTIVKMVRKEPYVSSFVLYDINSEAMICYNEERYYPVASTVKAPFVMSCLWQIEEGTHSLEDTMEYTKEYSVRGDGVIKKEDIGTVFTVKELMEHAILISDDIGYLMLQGKFGYKNYNQFLRESGNKVTIDGESIKWGQTSAMDSLRNWKEVYRYINSDSENAAFFAELIKNTNKSFVRNVLGDEYVVYNKMGWVYGQCCHDHAIVMDEQPYLMVIMTMGNARTENQKFMEELAVILNGVHEEMVSGKEPVVE
ncbi:MAG: serine hydrolase [Lachnospiraceae bacterium]|nr:serine hydrolase [Lachnospiraceae bacterium]